MNKIRWYGPTLLLLVTILLVLIGGPPLARQLAHQNEAASIVQVKNNLKGNISLAELSEAFKQVAKAVEPSVVSITVFSKRKSAMEDELRKWFFGPEGQAPIPDREKPNDKDSKFEQYDVPQEYGSGSGWIMGDKGHIITNNHVVDGADRIVVRFHNGAERDAKLVGTDLKTDIAVIMVDSGPLHAATLATKPVEQGEIVFAFGSPFRFEFSMSQGIVSGMGRRLGILQGQQGYENFIQTDAAINPGNSGGPLTNIYGEVVGMNTAIATRTGGNQGLGFAIPVAMVKNVVDQLIEKGKVSRGYLGVYIEDLSDRMARTFGYEGKGALVVNPIAGSPADKAGLKRGDIITKINDFDVESAEQLRRLVASYLPGSKLKVDVYRLENPTDLKGKMTTVTITIEEQPQRLATAPVRPGVAPDKVDEAAELLGKLGLDAESFTKELAQRLGVEFTAGVVVTRVRPNSAASVAGLSARHVITHVMGKAVETVEALVDELKKYDLSKGVRLSVMEGDTPRFILLELSQK